MRAWAMVLAVGISTVAGGAARAQTWQRAPLLGGQVRDLAFDPAKPGVAYAAVVGPGLYGSTDSGRTFVELPLPGEEQQQPRQVLVSRGDPGVLFVCEAGANGVLRSDDGGKSWTAVLSAPDRGCTAMAEGKTPGSYFAATYTDDAVRLHSSTDGGKTWTPQLLTWAMPQGGFDTPRKVTSLVQLASGRLVLAFAQRPPDFFLSSGCMAYTDDASVLTRVAVSGYTMELGYTGSLIMALFEDKLRSSPDGATWTDVPFSFGSSSYSSLYRLRYEPAQDVFLALGKERVLQSQPGAGNYAFDAKAPLNQPRGLSYDSVVAADPHEAEAWLVGSYLGGEGVARRGSEGPEWSQSSGIEAPAVSYALSDAATGYFYAANYEGRAWFGKNGASSLRSVFRGSGLWDETITAIAYDLADPKRVLLGVTPELGAPALYELKDAISAPDEDAYVLPPHQAWIKAPDPTTPVDGAKITVIVADGMTRFVALQPAPAAASSSGQYLYRSLDGGATYQALPLTTAGAVWQLVRNPQHPLVLYAGAGDGTGPTGTQGLFRSDDNGDSWQQLAPLPALDGADIRFIAIDSQNSQNLWVGTSGWGFWQSVDGGTTFTDLSFGASSDSTLSVTFSPEHGVVVARTGRIYARQADATQWSALPGVRGVVRGLIPGGLGAATESGLFVDPSVLGMPGAGGGAPGGGGVPGLGGSAPGLGGNVTGAGASAHAGAPGSGGSALGAGANGAGAAAAAPASDAKNASGCGCRTAPSSGTTSWGLLLAGLVLARRRGGRIFRRRPEP